MKKTLFALLIPISFIIQAQVEKPSIEIAAKSDLYYKPVSILVNGLPPETKVTLVLNTTDAKGHKWASSAMYISDKSGSVDLNKAPSVGGSYTGIYPMGLFWSLESDDYHQIATNNGFTAKIDVITDGETIATKSFYRRSSRELKNLGIRGIQKRGNIFANYYIPDTEGKKPAIIFLGGSGGNFRQERVTMYANEGFAVIDLKYFRGEGLPDGIVEIPLEYVRKAHKWLMEQPEVDPEKIGIIGRSRGSELAMLYATKYDVSFVIAQAPSSVVWFGWAEDKSSWSYQGKPFAYAEYTDEESVRIEKAFEENGIQYHDGPKFLSAFGDEEMIERASISVEEIDCPILFISGKDDKVWPATMMADRMVKRLAEKNFKHEFQHLSYKEAGHNFAGGGQGCGIPYLPAEDYSNGAAKGGTDKGNALAAIDSWNQLLAFINRSLNEH